MSDFLLGGIIGGGFSLLVSVVTLVVQGYFSTKNAKITMELQRNQRQEERLIEYRSKYLIPLKDLVNNCCKYTNQMINQTLDAPSKFSQEKVPHSDSIKMRELIDYLNNMDTTRKMIEQELLQIDIARSQVSDRKLSIQILEAHIYYYEFSKKFLQDLGDCMKDWTDFMRRAADVLKTAKLDPAVKPPVSTFAFFNFETTLSNETTFVQHMQNINFRIEQLMTGTK